MNWLQKMLPLDLKWRVVLLLVCIWEAPNFAHAQNENKCVNSTLQKIVEQLEDISTRTEKFNGEIIVPRVSSDCHISIERDKKGKIEHVGFKLFNRELMESHSVPIYRFMERYMLELFLLEDDKDIYTRLKMDRVKISSEIYLEVPMKKGLQKVISENFSDCSIFITNNGQNNIVSCVKSDKVLAQIIFPLRYELITGFSKLEAESLFYPQLLQYLAVENQTEENPLSLYDLQSYKDSLYCTYEEFYMLEDVVSTSYYRKDGDNYIPLYGTKYTAESLYNLFNASHNLGVIASVSQSLYGIDKNISYEVPVKELACYLRSQGCRLYTGIKGKKGREMQFVVMAVNSDLGYQHLLICSGDNRVLNMSDESKIKIKMYCHIPTHNVSSLLGE